MLKQAFSKKNVNQLPLVATYNKLLHDLSNIAKKQWNILKIDGELNKVFTEPPMIALRRNRNFRNMIGGNTILDNKKVVRTKCAKVTINANLASAEVAISVYVHVYVCVCKLYLFSNKKSLKYSKKSIYKKK